MNIVIQEDPIEEKTILCIEGTAGSPHSEAHPDLPPGDPELHQDHPIGTMTKALPADSLEYFQRVS